MKDFVFKVIMIDDGNSFDMLAIPKEMEYENGRYELSLKLPIAEKNILKVKKICNVIKDNIEIVEGSANMYKQLKNDIFNFINEIDNFDIENLDECNSTKFDLDFYNFYGCGEIHINFETIVEYYYINNVTFPINEVEKNLINEYASKHDGLDFKEIILKYITENKK